MHALAFSFVLLLAPARAAPLEVPRLERRVTDLAGALSPSEQAALEEKLRRYEARTGHQFAVLLVPSLQGEPIEELAIRVAERWGLGTKKRDDGLLVVVALKERQVRVEVGYGLEAAIPDVIASRVIRDVMVPRFAQGQLYDGLDGGLDALMQAAAGEALGPPPRETEREGAPGLGFVLFLLLGAAMFLQALPGLVRVPLVAGVGALLGLWLLGSLLLAIAFGLLGAVVALLFGGAGRGFFFVFPFGGFGGGFGGPPAGGGFAGGGGATGRW